MSDCPTPASTGDTCPNTFCDDRLVDLPSRTRVRLIGAEPGGRCLVEFPKGAKGFVVADGDGFTVTELPCVEIPVATNYAIDPTTGAVIVDDCGVPIPQANPGFDNIIITDENGCQNRLGGLVGVPADLHWDGVKFILQPTEGVDLLDVADYPVADGYCETHDVVLRSQIVCDPTKGEVERAFLARRSIPVTPYGSMVAFGGPAAAVPAGWVLCDGGSYDQVLYGNVYRVIGLSYGGSGNSFKVPDMRSRYGVGAAPSAEPPILPGEGIGGPLGGSETDGSQTTFLPRYVSLWNTPGISMDYNNSTIVTGTVPTTTLASETATVNISSMPVNASQITVSAWAIVGNEVSGIGVRNLINVRVEGTSAWLPIVAANSSPNIQNVADFQRDEALGSRFDIDLPDGHDGDVTLNVRMDIQRRPATSNSMQYGGQLFQHGFRLKGAVSGDGGLASNYIMFMGAASNCSNE
jgi:microcystin-dependent protein